MEQHHFQQRSRERTYPMSENVAWGRATGGTLLPARVHDTSDSGVGLLVAGPVDACLGQMIRVVSRESEYPRRARVVHLTTHSYGDESETTLGCRWITGAERRHRHACQRSNSARRLTRQ